MAESRCFFSWLIIGLASYVQRRVGVRGRTDRRRQNNVFFGMIDGGNTMLLLPVASGMIDGRNTVLLLLAG
jgi:hypothetical protein